MSSIQESPAGAAARLSGGSVFAAAATAILRALLARGPAEVDDLPRGWPLTRMHLHVFVDRMIEQGWVVRSADTTQAERVRLTRVGARVAAGPSTGGANRDLRYPEPLIDSRTPNCSTSKTFCAPTGEPGASTARPREGR
jgi:hypothetical protein